MAVSATAADFPSDSLYQLELELTDQQGRAIRFDEVARGPAMVSMFYASCPHTCPILITSMQLIERELPGEQRNQVRVLLVSLDPERDTPERLAELAARHGADLSRWIFARAAPGDVRLLAAALDIRYRKLPDGEFNHSAAVTLLDPDGRPVARTSKLGAPDPEFVAELERLTRVSRPRP